jgi:hypothetical protein
MDITISRDTGLMNRFPGRVPSKADIKAQGMARRDYGFSAFPDEELGRQTYRRHCVRMGSDP